MMAPTFSLVVNHTPWRPERVASLEAMHAELFRPSRDPLPVPTHPARAFLNEHDYRGGDWQQSKVTWALEQWRWSAEQPTTHHVFLTDDLHLAPGFWRCLSALVEAAKGAPAIGLLSNHPKGPELAAEGWRWYRTNSWIVGPAYVLEHGALVEFLRYFEALPDGPHTVPGTKAWANDDSSINEWITRTGRECLHPLPTIIEHRADLESTVGHGDEYSRERLSWRWARKASVAGDGRILWSEEARNFEAGQKLDRVDFWDEKGGPAAAPLLTVGGG